MALVCKVSLVNNNVKYFDLSGVLAMIEEDCLILRGSIESVTIPLRSILYSETIMFDGLPIPSVYKARTLR